MKLDKRMQRCLTTGAVLGVFCIVGGGWRMGGYLSNWLLLLAIWYNRVLMGLVIGLAGRWKLASGAANWILRGALLGLLVSFGNYLSTGLSDPVTFVAGIFYGVIIEYVARR